VAVRDYIAKYVADLTGYRLEPAIRETEQLERATDSAADEAVRDWRKISDAAADAARKIDRSTGSAGISGDMRDLRTDAADTGREVGQEFASNLGESLASGDASRIVQDTGGGLIASLALAGPIGAAVAAGGALALALWNAFESTTKARRERVLTAAQTIYDGLLAQGVDFVKQWQDDVLREFFDPKSENDIARGAKAAADALGSDLGAALAGGPDSIAAYADQAYGKVERLQDLAAKGTATGAQREELERWGQIIAYVDELREQWGLADKAARDYARTVQRLPAAVQATLRPGGRDAGQVPYASGGRS
jgi:hypothetical protein